MKTRTIEEITGTPVAGCGYWTVFLRIREQATGWGVNMTPYEAILIKIQTGGYDNGPWPGDGEKQVPLGHVLSVMQYEGKSFNAAMKSQFSGIEEVLVDESLYEEIKAACREAVKKVRRRIEDYLRKTDSQEIFKLSRELKINGDELGYKPRSWE